MLNALKCVQTQFGFEENSEYIIFNFKKESVRKIEVIFKTQVDRNQIAIGDLQIFYTESDAVVEVAAPSCVAMEIMEEKFEEIDNEVCDVLVLVKLVKIAYLILFSFSVGNEEAIQLSPTM